MSKVVLIRPTGNTKHRYSGVNRIPLALLYLGTVLKVAGHIVKIIDATTDRDYKTSIIKECYDADIVGITALTSEVKNGLEISKLIKDEYDISIVWGGIHPSLFPELTCQDSLVDYVISGDGEYALLELVECIEKKEKLNDIASLSYKVFGRNVITNPERSYADLNKLPPIDYTLIDMDKYYEGGTWRMAVDVQTSRGCTFHCKYCVNTALNNHKVRTLNAERVVDECERLIKEYGANYITFVDDNFFINKKRAVGICEGIIKRNLKFKWFAEIRADYFRDGFIDKEFLELAEKSGLSNLTIGAESGNQHQLDLIGKEITVDNIIDSALYLSKTNIVTAYSFIIGLPDETKSDIVQVISFIEKMRKIYPRAVYNISTLRAYPGSELTEGFIKQGWIKEPQSLRQFAEREYNKVYTESPARPIWHCDPNFAYSVAQYSSIAYGPYSGPSIKNNLRYASILMLPEVTLQKIARWRLSKQFFGIKIDLHISKLLRYLYHMKAVRSITRWRK